MPVPSPHKNESREDFIARAHRALATEFPDNEQRNAVVFRAWRDAHGESDEEKATNEKYSDSEYRKIEGVPVLKEHAYKRPLKNPDGSQRYDESGKPLETIEKYDLKALQAITENCNRRIRETQNFAPITDIHTGKRMPDGRLERPELFGFAGPFRLGVYGNEDRDDGEPFKGRWAIFQDEHWFRDKIDAGKVDPRERPTRSPEIFCGRPIEKRFLSPVTALGAETPALDMGMHYAQDAAGQLLEQYSAPNIRLSVEQYAAACMPAATNVAPASEDHNKAKYAQYDMASMSSDEIGHHVAFHQEQEAHHRSEHDRLKQTESSHPDFVSHAQRAFGHVRAAEFHKGEHERLSAHLQSRQPKMKPLPGFAEAIQKMTLSEIQEEIAKYAADPETVNACVAAVMNILPMKQIQQLLQDRAAPANPNKDPKEQLAEGEEGKVINATPGEKPVDTTAAQGKPGEHANEPPKAGLVPPEKKGKKQMKDETNPANPNKPEANDETQRFELQEFMRNQKVAHDALVAKYDALSTRTDSLEEENKKLRQEKNTAVRTHKIMQLRQHYAFDEAAAIAKYAQADEAVYQTWADTIVSVGQKIPVGAAAPTLFVPGLDMPVSSAQQQEEIGQYGGMSENDTELVMQYQQEQMMQGNYLEFKEAKEAISEKLAKKSKKEAKKLAKQAAAQAG